MNDLTPAGRTLVEELARAHGVSVDAVTTLLRALVAGQGTMAQFSHPELGGMGQWAPGGMVMIGDMFNHGLKARVDAICGTLSSALASQVLIERPSQGPAQAGFIQPGNLWWPAELGSPAASGGQNDLRYAYFPAGRRLAVEQGGSVTVYDTGEHQIGGFSQQQGPGQSLGFSSQLGSFAVTSLPVVSGAAPAAAAAAPAQAQAPLAERASPSGGDIMDLLEKLAELHRKGILSDAEFAAKKAELLARL